MIKNHQDTLRTMQIYWLHIIYYIFIRTCNMDIARVDHAHAYSIPLRCQCS